MGRGYNPCEDSNLCSGGIQIYTILQIRSRRLAISEEHSKQLLESTFRSLNAYPRKEKQQQKRVE